MCRAGPRPIAPSGPDGAIERETFASNLLAAAPVSAPRDSTATRRSSTVAALARKSCRPALTPFGRGAPPPRWRSAGGTPSLPLPRFLSVSLLDRYWFPAREAAGRPDLRFHDLRHTQAVFAAASGATLAELMARLVHSTVGAALRYQHAAAGRDAAIAAKLSAFAAEPQTVQ